MIILRPPARRWPAVSRGVPWCPVVTRGVRRCWGEVIPRPPVRRWPAVSRGVPCCPVVTRGVRRCWGE
eukprot:8369714-Pyramimonas_sp.AAC.1